MARALILSGGIFHDFPATSGLIAEQLARLGCDSQITEELEDGLARLEAFDLLVVNALRWRMLGEKYDPYRDKMAYSPSPAAREAVIRHLERGRNMVAMHTAVICFDDWEEWGDILGAQWRWGQSGHPPPGRVRVTVNCPSNPLVAGIAGFDIDDEVYGFLDHRPGLEPLLTSAHGGTEHPLLWVRRSRGARVAVDLLGHGPESLQTPAHRAIVERMLASVLE